MTNIDLRVIGTPLLASVLAFACSSGLPDEKPAAQGGQSSGGAGAGGKNENSGGSRNSGGTASGGTDTRPTGGRVSTEGGAATAGGDGGNGNAGEGDAGSPSAGAGGSGGADDPGCNEASNWEINDSAALACSIPFQTTIQSKLTPPADKEDYYRFAATKGVVYTLELSNTSAVGGFDERLRMTADLLVGGASTPLLPETAAQARSAVFPELRPLENGYIVTKLAGAAATTYELVVVPSVGTKRDAATLEPNNSGSTAAPLSLSTPIDGELSAPFDLADYFRIPVDKAKTYSITISVGSGTNAVTLDGKVTKEGENDGTSFAMDGTDPKATRYFSFTPGFDGSALLKLSAVGAATYQIAVYPSTLDGLQHDANSEPNNTPSTAAPLGLGQALENDINNTSDYLDYFQTDVVKGQKYTLTVSNVTGLTAQFGIAGTLAGATLFEYSGSGSTQLVRTFAFTPSQSGSALFAIDHPAGVGHYTIGLTQTP
jgi:hypothetical protein